MSLRRSRILALALAVLLASTDCARHPTAEPHPGKTAHIEQGAPLEPLPTTTQQAQDAVYRYYQKTLRELPEGYALDNSRYGGKGAKGGSGATVVACDDYAAPNDTPARYSDSRVINTPPDTNNIDLVAKIGEIWRGWGWRVEERDGFNIPNRFGTGPDGYTLMVESDSHYPVMVKGVSPCFPGDKTRFEPVPVPHLITRDKLDYEE